MNESGPVPLVLDLRITHDRFGSSSDPSRNGNLHYPNNMDRSLIEDTDDKIRKYRSDCNNNPPDSVSFMTAITSSSGRLHSEFVRLLFLQAVNLCVVSFYKFIGKLTNFFFNFRVSVMSGLRSNPGKKANRLILWGDGAPSHFFSRFFFKKLEKT